MLGLIEAKEENYSSAILHLLKAKEINPKNINLLVNIGNVYICLDLYQDALLTYKEALKQSPNNLKILKSLLKVLITLETWEEVEMIAIDILKIDNANVKAIAVLIKAFKEQEKLDVMGSFLNKINFKINSYLKLNSSLLDFSTKSQAKSLKKKVKSKISKLKKGRILILKTEEMILAEETNMQNFDRRFNNNKKRSVLKRSTTKKKTTIKVKNDKDNSEFNNLLKEHKNDINALFNIALINYKKKEFSLCEEYLFRVISIDPNFNGQSVNEKLGDIYYKRHQEYTVAYNYYLKAVSFNQTEILFVKLGRCSEKLNNYDQAIKEFRKSIELNENYKWGYFYLGCLLSLTKDHYEARHQLRKAYDIDKSNPEILVKYSQELLNVKDEIEDCKALSLSILQRAKINNQSNVDILIALSEYYEKQLDYSTCLKYLEEANTLPSFSNNTDRLYKLAQIYEKNNLTSKAVQIYKNILIINKNDVTTLNQLGFIYFRSQEYKRALKYFNYAILIEPKSYYANFGKAKIFQSVFDYDQAIESYNICKELKNENNYK